MSSSHLCNCACTRCLQREKVDGLITGLALGPERHFHAEPPAHNGFSLASLTSPPSFLSHIHLIAPTPPSTSPAIFSLFCVCKWRNTSGISAVLSFIFSRLLLSFLSPSLFSPLSCVPSKGDDSGVAGRQAAFLVFHLKHHSTFHWNAPALPGRRTHAWCQRSFLALPTISHYPFSSFCCAPLFAFRLFY